MFTTRTHFLSFKKNVLNKLKTRSEPNIPKYELYSFFVYMPAFMGGEVFLILIMRLYNRQCTLFSSFVITRKITVISLQIKINLGKNHPF